MSGWVLHLPKVAQPTGEAETGSEGGSLWAQSWGARRHYYTLPKYRPPWNCTRLLFLLPYGEFTQNDYKMVQISVDSCTKLQSGRPSLVQAQPWVWPQRAGKELAPSQIILAWPGCQFTCKVTHCIPHGSLGTNAHKLGTSGHWVSE